MQRRTFLAALASSAAAPVLTLALPSPASAADATLPSGPVRILVGFPPGGGTDILARILANKLGTLWNLPMLVENKAGAAGVIAANELVRQPGDGNTLMMGHINSLGIAPSLLPNLNYVVPRDITPLALVGQTPQVLIARAGQPAKTVAAVADLCRRNPGKVTFGSAGSGSAQHLALALFERTAAVSTLHVPYKGSSPMVTDLLGGQIEFAFEGMTTAIPFIKSGKMVAIAQTGARRARTLPEVPTVAESGYPGFDANIWFGMVGPAKMPEPMVRRINADIARVLAMPDVIAKLDEFGAENGGGSAERFGAFMQGERVKWAQLVKTRKISAD